MTATPSFRTDGSNSQPFGDHLSVDVVRALTSNKRLSFAELTGVASNDPKAHLNIVQVIALGGSNYADIAAQAHQLWLDVDPDTGTIRGAKFEAGVMYDLFTDEQCLYADHLAATIDKLTADTDIVGNRSTLRFKGDPYFTRRMLKVINPDYVYVDADGVEHKAVTGYVYYVNPIDGSQAAYDPTRTAYGQEIPWTFVPQVAPDGQHYLLQVNVKDVRPDLVQVGDRQVFDIYAGVAQRCGMIEEFATVLKSGVVTELDTSKRLDARVFGADAQLIVLCTFKYMLDKLESQRELIANAVASLEKQQAEAQPKPNESTSDSKVNA